MKRNDEEKCESSSPDGSVCGWVDVDFDLRAAGAVTNPLPDLAGSPVSVRQVVESGQGVGQETNIGAAETEAPALWPPFSDCPRSCLALLGLVLVRSAESQKEIPWVLESLQVSLNI